MTHEFHGSHTAYCFREIRQLAYISEFTVDLRYIKGEENTAADALSRVEALSTLSGGVYFERIAATQRDDPEFNNHPETLNSLVLKRIPLPHCTGTILGDMII